MIALGDRAMFKKKNIHLLLISSLSLIIASVHAETLLVTIPGSGGPMIRGANSSFSTMMPQQVALMKVSLSPEQKAEKISQISKALKSTKQTPNFNMPAIDHSTQKQLDMAGVPVHNQGRHGSCATFANVAALDALYGLLGEGAEISELCNLSLGKYIKNPDAMGGWEGSWGTKVLGQINTYGFMRKDQQSEMIDDKYVCGGLLHYPTYSKTTGTDISSEVFLQFSDKRFTDKDWHKIMIYGDHTLREVKKSLNSGHRVTIGSLLAVVPKGSTKGEPGTLVIGGSYNGISDDAWVMIPEVKEFVEQESVGGHEMIITGYNDHYCANITFGVDNGKQQCGLLTLRNSWGTHAGDHGNYYMTYKFFTQMVIEAQEIGRRQS
ncbi:C1 family peptidase [Piscirickettsia salmonis]|uniref:C1 family peptidase n=1 Tax=Piscirickettsia salmonis TaxID=1238 RepID=UPI0012BACF75|nr:C1 family peptidase [Piscirickettsia salmonis]